MAGKTARKRPRSFRNAPGFQTWTSGTGGDWLNHWHASLSYAAERYAKAMRERAEAAIDKYDQALLRRLELERKRRGQCPGT